MIWTYLADALWVLALAIMFGASRQSAARLPARVRLMGAELPRGLVLWALPGGAFLLSLWFAVYARTADLDGDAALILFGVRALTASTAALLHLRWLAAAHKP
jgi:hypothetical protein